MHELVLISRNRLLPRYILYSNQHHDTTSYWAATKQTQRNKTRERKEKQMPTPADRLNENDPQLLRPPENSHHEPSTPKRRLPSNIFKKESDDDDSVARTSPRVSPVRGGWWGRGTPEALQEGTATPAGVTTSVPDKPTMISPDGDATQADLSFFQENGG
jgi:hypothetical protein